MVLDMRVSSINEGKIHPILKVSKNSIIEVLTFSNVVNWGKGREGRGREGKGKVERKGKKISLRRANNNLILYTKHTNDA